MYCFDVCTIVAVVAISMHGVSPLTLHHCFRILLKHGVKDNKPYEVTFKIRTTYQLPPFSGSIWIVSNPLFAFLSS